MLREFSGGPPLADLIAAVRAEAPTVQLDGALRRAGAENVVLETDQWIYRFPREHVDFDRELTVLRLLADRVPVRIPHVEWVGRRSRFAAYRKIVGQPLQRDRYRAETRTWQLTLAQSMAEYLAAVHVALTDTEIAAAGIPAFFPLTARAALINLDDVPALIRGEVAALLNEAVGIGDDVGPPVLLHNDFTSDNLVLEDDGRLLGVWDFSGVCVGPASFDFRYVPREPAPLTGDVVSTYERLTGRPVHRGAFRAAARIGDVVHLLRRARLDELVRMVQGWRRVDSASARSYRC